MTTQFKSIAPAVLHDIQSTVLISVNKKDHKEDKSIVTVAVSIMKRQSNFTYFYTSDPTDNNQLHNKDI